MSLTPSNMLPLGTEAPNFELWDSVSDSTKTLNKLKGTQGTLILFICNHCPFVIHINEALVSLSNNLQNKGIGVVAISSNDVENYPQDGPKQMQLHAKNANYAFPYLYDETQSVAKGYEAACTPDFFLFDADLKLVYRGQLDDSRPGNGLPVDGADLLHAVQCMIENKTNARPQKPSIGCNIKWKIS
ncbi:thioredoxin family protein [Formosa sp. Hel1_33_131]|uniref:thioredoxin family protein n=1 Tax=Formosa sp. Hel1_33_131 TaxID=1336794 RepID=UPI00084E2083|nr:thioredoxin family protein [Formosa sp. Hel1_33_131]